MAPVAGPSPGRLREGAIRVTPEIAVSEHRFVVPAEDAGERLDRWVASRIQGISRTRIQALVEGGCVQVDGKLSRPSHGVRAGEEVVLRIPAVRDSEVAAEAIPLDVLYEDEDIIVIRKPAGLVVHPAAGHPGGTLVNALLHHCGSLSAIGGERRPGIVHRLDKGTSGLLVAAKTDDAHLSLSRQFHDRAVSKTYVALVFGRVQTPEGVIDTPIGRHPRQRKKMAVARGPEGRPSRTSWRLRERIGGMSLLEVRLHTGRTHQIRVHLAEIGYPIVGDVAYGGRREKGERDPVVREALGELGRPFLHAFRLGFRHPRSGESVAFEAALPVELEDLLRVLRERATER